MFSGNKLIVFLVNVKICFFDNFERYWIIKRKRFDVDYFMDLVLFLLGEGKEYKKGSLMSLGKVDRFYKCIKMLNIFWDLDKFFYL